MAAGLSITGEKASLLSQVKMQYLHCVLQADTLFYLGEDIRGRLQMISAIPSQTAVSSLLSTDRYYVLPWEISEVVNR